MTLAATNAYSKPAPGGAYFALFVNHYTMVTASNGPGLAGVGGRCFDWGVPAAVLEERIVDSLNSTYLNHSISDTQIEVSRDGFGDGTSSWGYTYTLS